MSKRLLIIEDNDSKLNHLRQFCEENLKDYEVEDRRSYNSALSEVVHNGNSYDLILLDVSMNTYDISPEVSDGEQEPLAGSNILRFMKLRKIKVPVIVVTMYESFVDGIKIDKLDEGFREKYAEFYKGFVYYSLRNEDWMNRLKELIKTL
jgi:CheY-like chemotaxis protein